MQNNQNSTPTTASTSSSPSTSSNETSSSPSTSSNETPSHENGPTKRESLCTVEDRYPGNVFKGQWHAVSLWAFCPVCSSKRKAEIHASTEIKKKAKNTEYEMVGTGKIIYVKTIPIEAGHFNPGLSPCAEETCKWENCVACKAAYVIPEIVKRTSAEKCSLPKSEIALIQKTGGVLTGNSPLPKNEQSKAFCEEVLCINMDNCGWCVEEEDR